jgi:hypothetical protein
MSQEIAVQANLTYSNPAIGPLGLGPIIFNFAKTFFNITGKNYIFDSMSVPTTSGGTAIPVSGLANVGWAMFWNLDPTNYVDIMTVASGTAFIRLLPGECALFRFTPGITAPAMLAHTAACVVQFLILEI